MIKKDYGLDMCFWLFIEIQIVSLYEPIKACNRIIDKITILGASPFAKRKTF
jgi:hypothetical protein